MISTQRETTQARRGSFVAVGGSVRTALLLSLFAAQSAVFAAALASGKIPPVVLNLFRALLAL